jgi:hypothetical protein
MAIQLIVRVSSFLYTFLKKIVLKLLLIIMRPRCCRRRMSLFLLTALKHRRVGTKPSRSLMASFQLDNSKGKKVAVVAASGLIEDCDLGIAGSVRCCLFMIPSSKPFYFSNLLPPLHVGGRPFYGPLALLLHV